MRSIYYIILSIIILSTSSCTARMKVIYEYQGIRITRKVYKDKSEFIYGYTNKLLGTSKLVLYHPRGELLGKLIFYPSSKKVYIIFNTTEIGYRESGSIKDLIILKEKDNQLLCQDSEKAICYFSYPLPVEQELNKGIHTKINIYYLVDLCW